jgi:hypothetical protein
MSPTEMPLAAVKFRFVARYGLQHGDARVPHVGGPLLSGVWLGMAFHVDAAAW